MDRPHTGPAEIKYRCVVRAKLSLVAPLAFSTAVVAVMRQEMAEPPAVLAAMRLRPRTQVAGECVEPGATSLASTPLDPQSARFPRRRAGVLSTKRLECPAPSKCEPSPVETVERNSGARLPRPHVRPIVDWFIRVGTKRSCISFPAEDNFVHLSYEDSLTSRRGPFTPISASSSGCWAELWRIAGIVAEIEERARHTQVSGRSMEIAE